MKALIGLMTALAAIYAGLGAALYVYQRSQQYFPDGGIDIPAYLAARGVVPVRIETEDGEWIAAWYRPAEDGMPTLLYCPGNGGSVADSHVRFADMIDSGFGFLAISYRGYPGSTGSPSEAGLFLDGIAGFDWLVARDVAPDRIVMYGWSLGSGVVAKVANVRPAGALVLESPFLSAEAIARARYPMFPVGLLMKDTYRTDLLLPQLRQPLVVIHGSRDATIPVDHGRTIADTYRGQKIYLEVAGGSHTDLWGHGVWPRLVESLEALKVLK